MTPADEIRTAADDLRQLGRAALGNGRPWRYAKGIPSDSVRTETGWEVAHGDDPSNLRYIAAMNPAVGLVLADWLESVATALTANTHPGWQECVQPHALAVARAITARP